MNLIYDRQNDIRMTVPTHVAVIGAGGVGTWVSLLSAMVGVSEISVYDPDKLEVTNLNRLPFTVKDVGRYKVDVLRDKILELRPDCCVLVFRRRFEIPDDIEKYNPTVTSTVFFDCTDNVQFQQAFVREIEKHNATRNVTRIRVGYNIGRVESYITVTSRPPAPWGEGANTYNRTPSYVVPAVVAAAMAVDKVLFERENNLSASLSQLFVE